jgi:hypothetical protein
MHLAIQAFLELDERALHWIVHLLGLTPSTTKDNYPAILAKLFAERLGILLQLLVAGIQAGAAHLKFITSGGERLLGSCLEDGEAHRKKVQRRPQGLHPSKKGKQTWIVLG